MRPKSTHRSTWFFGSQSNLGFSPNVLTTAFASLPPATTSSAGRFGSASTKRLIFSSSAPCSSSISLMRSAISLSVARAAVASSPRFLMSGISLLMRLRSAFIASFSAKSARRRWSQESSSERSTSYWRFFSASRTKSGFERIKLRSSIVIPPQKIRPRRYGDGQRRGATRIQAEAPHSRAIGRTRPAFAGMLGDGNRRGALPARTARRLSESAPVRPFPSSQ